MSVITFRVPDSLRKRMMKVKINWSDYVRRAISEALDSDTKKDLLKKVHQMNKGRSVPKGFSEQLVRHMRDRA